MVALTGCLGWGEVSARTVPGDCPHCPSVLRHGLFSSPQGLDAVSIPMKSKKAGRSCRPVACESQVHTRTLKTSSFKTHSNTCLFRNQVHMYVHACMHVCVCA